MMPPAQRRQPAEGACETCRSWCRGRRSALFHHPRCSPTLVAPSSMQPRTAASRVAVLATATTSRRVTRLQGGAPGEW